MVVEIQKEAQAIYSGIIMKRNSEEWTGRNEEKLEKEMRVRTASIRYLKGGLNELTETTTMSDVKSGRWEERGKIVKRIYFNSEGKPISADVEFHFGGWRHTIRIEVQKENERIDKSSNTVKTDFGPKKFEGKPKNLFYGPILGYPKGTIDASLSVKNTLLSYTEVTDASMSGSRLIANIEKQYDKDSGTFQSFSSSIYFITKTANRKLGISVNLEHERNNALDFLSQQPVDSWKKEMELKTGNLK